MKLRRISRFITEGDSLSDRGTLNKRRLFGIIPMSWVSGLNKDSPRGRFTNGLAWDDHVTAMFANVFLLNELKEESEEESQSLGLQALDLATNPKPRKYNFKNDDIADAILSHQANVEKTIQNAYSFTDDKQINYKGQNLSRNYNEGGLTAFDYKWVINNIRTWTLHSFKYFCTCLILATLAEKRAQLLEDDKKKSPSAKHKAETLVIEWSGANDCILANEKPSRDAARKAVAGRVANIKELMKHGYQNFIWFNLPNISLTPRYQAKKETHPEEFTAAEDYAKYFNEELEKAKQELSLSYPQCSFELFDVYSIFERIYADPEKYNFSSEKKTKAYTKSDEFINSNGMSPAKGYMFWDDVHPSADMHALLASNFYRQFSLKYDFRPPKDDAQEEDVLLSEKQLLAAYQNAHAKKTPSTLR